MEVPERVEECLASQPEPKQADLRRLHAHILAEYPGCRLWFTDGANADGKVVANPNIGYGACTIASQATCSPSAVSTGRVLRSGMSGHRRPGTQPSPASIQIRAF